MVHTVLFYHKYLIFKGLQLELNVEQYDYLGDIADAAGFRVIIHNQTDFPFPEDEGFSVQPGSLTSVAIDRVRPFSLFTKL